jgi:hypothetical protein
VQLFDLISDHGVAHGLLFAELSKSCCEKLLHRWNGLLVDGEQQEVGD